MAVKRLRPAAAKRRQKIKDIAPPINKASAVVWFLAVEKSAPAKDEQPKMNGGAAR